MEPFIFVLEKKLKKLIIFLKQPTLISTKNL